MVAFYRRYFRRTVFSASTPDVDHVTPILSIPNRGDSIDKTFRGL
jgi:hypothetical protein